LDILIKKVLEFFDEEVRWFKEIYTIKDRGIALGCGVDLNHPLILI